MRWRLSMVFSSHRKHLFLLFLGTFLALQPCLHANPTEISQVAAPKSWYSTLGSALNTTLFFAPAAYCAYEQSKNLYVSRQKELIGKNDLNAETKQAIQKMMIEMGIKDTPEILAMRNQAEFKEIPDSEGYAIVDSLKKNFLGIHATNACIFVDEEIINFDNNPLLSTFLVKRELAKYKNNNFSKEVVSAISLNMAQALALYKTIPLVTDNVSGLLAKAGWASFNKPNETGFFLNASRFTVNYIVCPTLASIFTDKLRAHIQGYYTNNLEIKLEKIVPRGYTVTLLKELIKLTPYYNEDEANATQYEGKEILARVIETVFTIAQKRYDSETLTDLLHTLLSRDAFFQENCQAITLPM